MKYKKQKHFLDDKISLKENFNWNKKFDNLTNKYVTGFYVVSCSFYIEDLTYNIELIK